MEFRLNKYISDSGYCSRREADRFIESGNVTVNGKRAVIGARVLPGQKVKVNGNLIESGVEPVYIAFNKPVGVVSTTDSTEKNNIVDIICHEQRIFPIGRLDKDSQGLILLTNDGDIVNKILRAGNNHKKEYIVTVNRPITPYFLVGMAQGVPILDRVTRKCEVEKINTTTFKISLIQGLNRQIRRMCEHFGYEVTKLERIQIMNIKLDKLGQGNWRNLTIAELAGLFDMLEASEKKAPVEEKRVSAAKQTTKLYSKDRPSPRKRDESDTEVNLKKENRRGKPKDAKADDPKAKNGTAKSKGKPSSGLRVGKQKVEKLKPAKKRRWY